MAGRQAVRSPRLARLARSAFAVVVMAVGLGFVASPSALAWPSMVQTPPGPGPGPAPRSAPATSPATPPPPSPALDSAAIDAKVSALRRAQSAVVRVRTTAVDEAQTTESLGQRRVGSGVVIDRDGLVLTIGYLILEAETVDIEIDASRVVPARVIATDVATGFGLVQPLVPLRVDPVPLGRSTTLAARQPLISMSGGTDGSVAVARMVSQRAFSGSWEYHIDQAIYTAPPRDDHSGAALFNDNGELVGIGSLVLADVNPADDPSVLPGNLFVPIDLLKPILTEMRAQGTSQLSRRPWLGVNSSEANGQIRVLRVNRESPAFEAGLRAGDRIEAIDGEKVTTLEQFYKVLWKGSNPQRPVLVEVRRGGQTQSFTVQSVDRLSTFKRSRGI
jgi:serine protease Do